MLACTAVRLRHLYFLVIFYSTGAWAKRGNQLGMTTEKRIIRPTAAPAEKVRATPPPKC
jgi:hypothetical protein